MDELDQAYIRFKAIRDAAQGHGDTVTNEADTRLKLIDPILTEVLGWPKWDILTEQVISVKDRLDYLLRDEMGQPCAVVEAKPKDVQLVTDSKNGSRYRLDGPVFKSCLNIIEDQVIPYCQKSRVEVGILTTGLQWVALLGNRNDGVALRDDFGIAFSSLDEIDHHFQRFYDLLSRHGHHRGALRRFILRAELRGEVTCADARRPVEPRNVLRLQRPDSPNSRYYSDLAALLDHAFRPIHEDGDMLVECFVESRESNDADQRLRRLTEQVIRDATNLRGDKSGAYHKHVSKHLDRVAKQSARGRSSGSHTIGFPSDHEPSSSSGVLVRLLGERSSGKTTFIRRFYQRQLPAKYRDQIIYIHLHLRKIPEITPQRLGEQLRSELELRLFGKDGPAHNEFINLYRDEWDRKKKKQPPSSDFEQLRKEFTHYIEQKSETDKLDYVYRMARFAASNRNKVICVAFDDFDHLLEAEVQILFQVAIALKSECPSVVTLAMDDTTAWRVRGIDLLDRQSPTTFWLPRPKVRAVLDNRFDYIRKHVGASSDGKVQRLEGRIGRGCFRWTADPEQLVKVLQNVFIWQTEDIVNWVEDLANHDLQRVFEVSKELIRSPVILIEEHFGAAIADVPPSKTKILRALIAPDHTYYLPFKNPRIVNIFSFSCGDRFALLLPARLLVYLQESHEQDSSRNVEIRGFRLTSRIQDDFETLGVSRETTRTALEHLNTSGLVQPYDPSQRTLVDADASVRINPSGRLHLHWSLEEVAYVRMMAETDQIIEIEAWRELSEMVERRLRAREHRDVTLAKQLTFQIASRYIRYLVHNAAPIVATEGSFAAVKRYEHKLLERCRQPLQIAVASTA